MRAFQDMLLGPLKAVLMRVLQQQLFKYIHNIELEELGLMGGDVVLENLELRKDVLRDIGGISTDYDFSRGFIKELRIHIPWTRLQSRPIEIKVKTVEIIITPITQTASQRAGSPWQHSRHGGRSTDEQASPAGASGWMQQLLTKVLANMSIEVSNLVLKYEDADVVLSAALKSLFCFSADPDREWTPAFASLDDPFGFLHKLVRASDLTVCLDRYCAPDPTRRRQVQAFEVPILNRSSFEVRLLACVWLVAPGPPESSMTAWEDQQAQQGQVEWQDSAEIEAAGVPPSPGRPGARWGLQWGAGEGPKPAPKNTRPVTVLGRLVGGDLRGSGVEESAMDGSAPGVAPAEAEGEFDELPIPSVCRLLRDGWSRRASSLYSPFFDGEAAWSRGEAAGASAPEGDGAHAFTPPREDGGNGGSGGQASAMPVPIVTADVSIVDLSFSLSNLQVRMMKELIERAVQHVAHNASQNDAVELPAEDFPPLPVLGEAPATSSWWPSFWRGTTSEDVGGDQQGRVEETANDRMNDGVLGRSSPASFESREFDAKFLVASASIGSVSLSLLEHQEQSAGRGAETEDGEEYRTAEDEEPESISVPVHGIGTVSILSTPVGARKQTLRPPAAFIVAEVKELVVDAHVLPVDDELSADVKVEVSSVVVRHAGLEDPAAPSGKSPEQSATAKSLDYLEPVISWGIAATPDAPTARGGDAGDSSADTSADPRSAAKVQQCLIDIARGSSQPDPAVGETGNVSELSGGDGSPTQRRARKSPAPLPTQRAPDSPFTTTPQPTSTGCALQYRLLKQKGGSTPVEGGGRGGDSGGMVDAVSTLVYHDIAVGALRVQLAEVMLEKLLRFSGVVSRQDENVEGMGDPAKDSSCEKDIATPRTTAPVSLVQVQGQPPRESRLSPRASDTGSGLSSPKALPPRPPTSSLETSLHLALRSVDVAVDLAGADGDFSRRGVDQAAFCVLSLSQLEVTGSESSFVSGVGQQQPRQQRGGQQYTFASPRRREEDESQRVCSIVLGDLSVVLVDGSVLVAQDTAPLGVSGSSPLMSRSFAQQVFLAAGTTNGIRRLVRLVGARVTAEILSKPVADPGPRGGVWSAPADSAARHGAPDFLFNASLDLVEVCASVGAALLVLEACLLAKKMNTRYPRADATSGLPLNAARWKQVWRRGVGASLEGISAGGVVKGGGGQLTGNMRRFSVGRIGGGELPPRESVAMASDVAVFEALPGERDGEGLSWALEISDDAGLTGVKLTTFFRSATLHYLSTKKAFWEMASMIKEWKAGAERLSDSSSAAVAKRSPLFEFDIRGLAVTLHLPFDLKLEVEDVSVGTPPVIQTAVLGRDGDRADGDLDMNLKAGDVWVYHQPYGPDFSPEDGSPTAIRCAARGIVAIRPSENSTAVSLESGHVGVRLTPAFCASFGLFIRFMVGPPPRPLAADSALALAAGDRPPNSFTFKLKVGAVDVDFLTGPCCPSAVSAAFVVSEVSMRQHATGAAVPEAGSQASFEMSFEAVKATQRRDPRRNAPALPQEAVQLIGTFLGKVPESAEGNASGYRLFSEWLSARKGADGRSDAIRPSFTQPFLVALGENTAAQAFSVMSTSSGPRHRLVNSLSLRLAPVLLVCYPPTFRILVGHYNRFAGNAFRMFRSRADMPRRRVALVSYDIDIRGCGAVMLASLVDGARGIHLSAGEVTFKEDTALRAAAVASPTGMGVSNASSSSLAAEAANGTDTTFAMSGFVGPVGMAFLQDWWVVLPAPVAAGESALGGSGVGAGVQLCAPIDLRLAVFYDSLDRCRQDVSLSSVQLYLEQPHFDLFVRVAQIFVAADFPGALPPTAPPRAAGGQSESAGNTAQVDNFLSTSLRLPLVQFVLANGKRNGPLPPVLEFDVASVRLARGGVFTVRHLSVNSWSQEVGSPALSGVAATAAGAGATGRDGSGCGYRVLGRSGQSEESGKDFLRMEVRVPEVRARTLGPRQPQLDVVIQVQPFDVHVNPSVLRSLTGYIAPVPFVEGSAEDDEVPFPLRHPPLVTPRQPNSKTPTSAAHDGDVDGTAGGETGIKRGSSAGEKVSTNFEKSAMTASASVRLLASQVTLELSSYPGGPAFMASTSHVFLRAITWPSDAVRARQSVEGGVQAGPEVFARLSRVSFRVSCAEECRAPAAADVHDAASTSQSDHLGDTVLKPFDVDVHLTRPKANAAGTAAGVIASQFHAAQGWHAGVYVDELYLRFGPLHTRSLELLADMFLPAVAAAELTAVELARGQRSRGTFSGGQGLSEGRIDDLLALDRVDCVNFAGDTTAVKVAPGQAVFFGVGTPIEGPLEGGEGASAGLRASEGKGEEEQEEGDGWVHCCEWRYWGPRRVAQIALPSAPLGGSVPLLDELVLDSLEVELSFVHPLSETYKAATRFNVPCRAPNGSPNDSFAGRSRTMVEPSQPILANTWRLSWRIPTWLRSKAVGSGGAPKPYAVSSWSAVLLRALSIRSTPAGPMISRSYVSATLVAQRLTLALLTEGGRSACSSSLSSSCGEGRGSFRQPEEIVRVVVGDVNVFAEAGAAARLMSVAARGSAVVAVDVQDFSNFLRLPLLSHALVKFDVSTCSGGGSGTTAGDGLLSPFRPVVSGAVDVHDAIVSVSVTAMQCVDQCIAELAQRPAGVAAAVAMDEPAARESDTTTTEKVALSSNLAKFTPPPLPRQSRQRSKRYVITNHTDRNLWFGQVSTTETLFLRAGEETSYRWRTIPPALAPGAAGRKDDASRLVLMLRLALHRKSGSGGGASAGAGAGFGGSYGAWTESFPADHAGTFMRLLRGADTERPPEAEAPSPDRGARDAVMLPLWVQVKKDGLETRIVFHGEWVFTNHLPQEVQVAWVTSAGVGNAGRRLVEPAGTRGGLKLVACGPLSDRAGGGSGETVESSGPVSCSALTASSSPSSSLLLEFRLATPDAAAFVGSVGPPPTAAEDSVAHAMAGREGGDSGSGGGGRGDVHDGPGDGPGDKPQGREEEDAVSASGPWGVTRQSEWVQARPSVYLALISCASTDPGIPGFVFWCVASRQASRAPGHRDHLGQMRIDLYPVALVRNRCSQPMRAVLSYRSGGGGWSERAVDSAEARQVEHKEAGCNGSPRSSYSLSRSTMAIQPGGLTAVCQQPFVDYDLAVTPTAATAHGLDSQAQPFLVSVPSELLSRRSKSTWLPLHSRALTENVLCPLVVVASRLLDADWPSLSLNVYPGLSVQNHLLVPLSLRMVFKGPLLGANDVSSVQPGEEEDKDSEGGRPGYARPEKEEQAAEPLLRRSSGGSESTLNEGNVDSGSGGAANGVTRVLRVPAETCHSAWDMFHSEGFPIPFLLPDVSLELGLDSQPEDSLATSAAGTEPALAAPESNPGAIPGRPAPREFAANLSRKLKVSLEDDLDELVLIPWETSSEGAVLPVFVTLEREVVLGGVELIRLAVHPRVVVHNATGLPLSLSLLSASRAVGGSHNPEGDVGRSGGGAQPGVLPLCRVRLTPEGNGSCMNLLALPDQRAPVGSPRAAEVSAAAAAAAAAAAGGRGGGVPESSFASDTDPPPGLLGKLSRMLGSGSYKASSQPAAGFSADVEVAFGEDDEADQAPATGRASAEGEGATARGRPGEEAASAGPTARSLHSGGADKLAVFSLHEPYAGSALVSQPSSLTVRSSRAQAVRVCVAVPPPGAEPTSTSPTRHVILYRDPQPDLTICNRSAAPVTLLFDCGALVEVGPGGTVEHSWQQDPAARDRSGSSSSSSNSGTARPPLTATGRRHSRQWSGSSRGAPGDSRPITPTPNTQRPSSSAPESPAMKVHGAGVPPSDARRSCVSSPAPRRARPPGKLGGDATLQHWFQCKGGGKDDAFLSWSDPVWVARGVQVMRFDSRNIGSGDQEGWSYRGTAQGRGGGGSDDDNKNNEVGGGGGVVAGSAREVQVHVVERAGGFVMSFAEGGFEGAAADGVAGVERGAGDAAAENRGVLGRWAATLEQHAVITVSGTTIQLLDDSNLQAVATAAGQESTSAARTTSERPSAMDGWIGGTWEELGGLLSEGASAHLPAAAIPAIMSVFVDASSVRLWRAAPPVRPGMSSLDLERSWHVKDRVGVDVSLGTLQIDNHVAGHKLPVIFCFREGGRLVQANEVGRRGDGEEAKAGCRFTMSLVLAESWEHSRVPSYLEKVALRSAPIDVCFEDSLLPPLLLLLERAGGGMGNGDAASSSPYPFAAGGDRGSSSSYAPGGFSPEGVSRVLPPALGASMVPRLFIQRVDIGALVVRATVQGYIPGKQVFLALDKSPLLFRPVSLRGVLARPDEIAEQIASNYAVDALLRSLAVVGSLEALGSPTTLLSEWGKGVYDLFAMPIKAMPQGPSSTVRATFRGVSSLLRHASAGTLSSVSGVTNALSRNLGGRGGVVRPIAGTMGLVHRTSKSLIASTGVDSEWTHAKAATAANPATAYLNADLWYRYCLLPAGHEFLYRTPALCSGTSYSQANVPVTIVLSSKAIFLYRGGSGCETLWKQIEHEDITLVEQSADHAPAELILNAKGYRRPRSATSPLGVAVRARTASASPPRVRIPATPNRAAAAAAATEAEGRAAGGGSARPTLEVEEVAVGGLLMKLSLPSSACCRELAQLLHGLSDKA